MLMSKLEVLLSSLKSITKEKGNPDPDVSFWQQTEPSVDFEISCDIVSDAISVLDGSIGLMLTPKKDIPSPWKPIITAPKNRVILTNEGTACYVDQKNWGSPVTNGWYLCSAEGNIPTCADEGISISAIEPTVWMDIPAIPK